MRLQAALALTLSSFACGGPSDSIESEPAPPVIESQTQSALVHWSLLSSSCPQDKDRLIDFEAPGTVDIEGDTIRLGLGSMPDLTGKLRENRAEISGVTTFFVEEEVTCSVVGSAEVRSNALVVAQATETLTSASTINCEQYWTLEIDY
jgi:hypothetical protein